MRTKCYFDDKGSNLLPSKLGSGLDVCHTELLRFLFHWIPLDLYITKVTNIKQYHTHHYTTVDYDIAV